MQQVGTREFVTARPVDPRQLPVLAQALGRKAVIGAGHAWVLHRRLLVRGLAALLALLFIVGAYEGRALIGAGVDALAQVVRGEFAAAGFGIERIQISGQRLTRDEDIVALLALAAGRSTLDFDVERARNLLSWLQAVDSVTVRKVYPDRLIVDIVEKDPVVRWRSDSTTYLIDAEGARIGVDEGAYAELPLVVGDGAADDALATMRLLERHPDLKDDLAALSRIGDRRWDLIYYTGLRVQLPEVGVAQALNQLDLYQQDYALLDRDVTRIDLRVPGMVALTPTVRDEETDAKP